jgi:hypothetical protein
MPYTIIAMACSNYCNGMLKICHTPGGVPPTSRGTKGGRAVAHGPLQQGYRAHKKLRPPLGSPYQSCGGALLMSEVPLYFDGCLSMGGPKRTLQAAVTRSTPELTRGNHKCRFHESIGELTSKVNSQYLSNSQWLQLPNPTARRSIQGGYGRREYGR